MGASQGPEVCRPHVTSYELVAFRGRHSCRCPAGWHLCKACAPQSASARTRSPHSVSWGQNRSPQPRCGSASSSWRLQGGAAHAALLPSGLWSPGLATASAHLCHVSSVQLFPSPSTPSLDRPPCSGVTSLMSPLPRCVTKKATPAGPGLGLTVASGTRPAPSRGALSAARPPLGPRKLCPPQSSYPRGLG